MKLYLDASVIVPLIARDALADQVDAMLNNHDATVIVSDFAAVEVASAINKRVRMGNLTGRDARHALSSLDGFTIGKAMRVEAVPADMKAAEAALRRLDLPLRTGDAINIAITDRVGATLATFSRKMAEAARVLGVAVVGDQEPLAKEG